MKKLPLFHFTLLKLRRLQSFHAALFRCSDLIRFRNYRANGLIFFKSHRFGEGNGTPLQYSCLENPMDGGAWQVAVHGVAKSRTGLKRLNSSSRKEQVTFPGAVCKYQEHSFQFFFFLKYINFFFFFFFYCAGSSLLHRLASPCCAWGSHCSGFSIEEHGLQGTGLQELQPAVSVVVATQSWCTGLVAPRHVGSSRVRVGTHVSCIGRQIIYH